jgi:S-formylglutathione hydrolase FrmB
VKHVSIDGLALLVVAIVVTLAAFVGAALLMGRLGRAFWAFLVRIVLMAMVSALVVVTCGIWVNRNFHFYSDWSDLFGTSATVSTQIQESGGLATNAVDQNVPATGTAAPAPAPTANRPPLPSPGQRFQTYQVAGAASGLTGRVLAILPAGYEDPANAGRLYPVIVALPGFPGSPEQYVPPGIDVGAAMDKKAAAGTGTGAIVIAPVTSFPSNTDTECLNGRQGQPQVETYLTRDVPEFVVRTLRVKSQRSAWSALGFSAGGYCAAMLPLLHPDVYATGIVLGGYFTPYFETPSYKPYGPGDQQWKDRYDLVAYIRRNPPPVALWVQTSKTDTLSYATSAPFIAAAKAPLSVRTLVEDNAGHRMETWDAKLPQAMDWLSATSKDFRP